jgi:hypothetical protein
LAANQKNAWVNSPASANGKSGEAKRRRAGEIYARQGPGDFVVQRHEAEGRSTPMGKLTIRNWLNPSAPIAQPISIVMGANLRKNSDEAPKPPKANHPSTEQQEGEKQK